MAKLGANLQYLGYRSGCNLNLMDVPCHPVFLPAPEIVAYVWHY